MKLSKSVVSRLTLVSNTRATTEYWSRYVAMTHSGWGRKVQTTKLWNSKIHVSLAGGSGEGKRKEKQRLTLLYKSNFHAKCSLPSSPLHFSFVALLCDPSFCHFLPSGLADPGLRHKLVLKVLDGEAFVCRALLDASTWPDGHIERPSAPTRVKHAAHCL